MEFKTKFNSKQDDGEKISNITIVEKSGYLETEKKIQSMLLSGRRPQPYADLENEENDGNIVVNRDLDITEAAEILETITNNIQVAVEETKKQKEDKKNVSNSNDSSGSPILDSNRQEEEVEDVKEK